MTSFSAQSFNYISDEPETVVALLATTRPFMNSSIIPVLLSDNNLWDSLCSMQYCNNVQLTLQELLISIFVNFCDTMQFTKKLRFQTRLSQICATLVVEHLIEKKRYFCRTLQHLDLLHNVKNWLDIVAGKLLNIRSLGLRSCDTIDDEDFEVICDNFPLLERLDLSGMTDISDEGLRHLAKLKNLMELDLSYHTNVEDISTFLKTGATRLQRLNLEGAEYLTDASFDFTGNHNNNNNDHDNNNNNSTSPAPTIGALRLLPSLTYINLHHGSERVTSFSFRQLQQHAPNLIELSVMEVTDEESYFAISEMQTLKSLRFADCYDILSESCLRAMMTNLCQLETIVLVGAYSLGDTCLTAISKSSSPFLRSVSLIQCHGFTDEGFRTLTLLKNLESLEIEANTSALFTGNIGEDHFFPKSLTKLRISYSPNVTAEGLKSMLKSLNSLRSLRLTSLAKISSKDLEDILMMRNNSTGDGRNDGENNTNNQNNNNNNCKQSLEELFVCSMKGVSDLRFVKDFVSLKMLDLYNTDLEFEEMRKAKTGFNLLSTSPLLEKLIITQREISAEDIFTIPPEIYGSLKKLEMCCKENANEALLKCISQMTSLEELYVTTRDTDDVSFETVKYCLDRLPRLKMIRGLGPAYNTIHSDPVLRKKYARFVN